MHHWRYRLSVLIYLCSSRHLTVHGFSNCRKRRTISSTSTLSAAPQRLTENVAGPLYVNDRCINCSACSMFAPSVFGRSVVSHHHIVERQPQSEQEIEESRAALRACPVAAIRLENQAFRNHRKMDPLTDKEKKMVSHLSSLGGGLPFPRLVSLNLPGAYFVGHHSSKSFGAAPYLLQSKQHGWILIDSPKYSKSAVNAIESLTGPEGPTYLILTHVDDTADHGDWKSHYPKLRRVFHSGDLGIHNWIGDETLENVEVLLSESSTASGGLKFLTLEGKPVHNDAASATEHEVLLVHTPGHSPGSIILWKLPTAKDKSDGIIFTGDTYSYTTRDGGHMTGFPRYGNDLNQQAKTLTQLLDLDWHLVAPGHGHARDYSNAIEESGDGDVKSIQKKEMKEAIDELTLPTRKVIR